MASADQAYLAVISSDREYLYPGAFNAPAEQVGVVTNPEPGVWEINVCTSWEVCEYKPSRPRPVKPTKVTVTARIVGGAITTSLWARVSGISEPGADLDIYLIDCSTPPAAPGPPPPGGTRDSYLDLFTHPKFGILAVTDHSDKRESGAGWTAEAHAWAASRPDGPRTLMGRILMRSAEFMLSDGSPAVVGG